MVVRNLLLLLKCIQGSKATQIRILQISSRMYQNELGPDSKVGPLIPRFKHFLNLPESLIR